MNLATIHEHAELIDEAFEQMQADPKAIFILVDWEELRRIAQTWREGLVHGATSIQVNEQYRLHLLVNDYILMISIWSNFFHTSPQLQVRLHTTVGKFLDALKA